METAEIWYGHSKPIPSTTAMVRMPSSMEMTFISIKIFRGLVLRNKG